MKLRARHDEGGQEIDSDKFGRVRKVIDWFLRIINHLTQIPYHRAGFSV